MCLDYRFVGRVSPAMVAALLSCIFVATCEFPPPPPTVEIKPDSTAIPVGGTVRLVATVLDDRGDTLRVPVLWEALDPEVARVDDDGTVHPVRLGRARIAAWAEGGADTATVVGTTSLTEDAFVVDSTELALVSQSGDHRRGVLRFDWRGRDPRPDPMPGSVLVGAQGEGFLRRVDSLAWSDHRLTVFTGPAALTDIYRVGAIELDVWLQQPFLELGGEDEAGARPGASPAILAAAGQVWSLRSKPQPEEICSYRQPPSDREIRCGPTVRSHVDSSAEFTADGLAFSQSFQRDGLEIDLRELVWLSPRARLSYRVNKVVGFPRGVEHVDIGFESELGASVEAAVRATRRSVEPFADSVLIGSFTRPFYGAPGGVPVKGRVTASVWAGYRVETGGEAELNSGSQEMIAWAEASLRWEDREWHQKGMIQPEVFGSAPTLVGRVGTTARVFVRPAIRIILYGTAGPEVAVEPYLEGRGEVVQAGDKCHLRTQLFIGGGGWAGVAWSPVTQKAADLFGVGEPPKYEFSGPRDSVPSGSTACPGSGPGP